MKVFENRMLTKIFGPKGKDNCGVENSINEELDMYNSPNSTSDLIKTSRMGEACSTYGERRSTYKVLVGKLEGWGDNIKIYV
jgi:hypothetical protein